MSLVGLPSPAPPAGGGVPATSIVQETHCGGGLSSALSVDCRYFDFWWYNKIIGPQGPPALSRSTNSRVPCQAILADLKNWVFYFMLLIPTCWHFSVTAAAAFLCVFLKSPAFYWLSFAVARAYDSTAGLACSIRKLAWSMAGRGVPGGPCGCGITRSSSELALSGVLPSFSSVHNQPVTNT